VFTPPEGTVFISGKGDGVFTLGESGVFTSAEGGVCLPLVMVECVYPC
jgi:hypothetical protein